MNPKTFFGELKRRNVYKVAITYTVVAWLLLQVASILLPTFEAPTCVMKAFVVFLALGFVMSVMISWAFEATPEGLKRTADVPPDVAEKLPTWSRRKFATFVIVVALLAVGLLAYQFLRSKTTGTPRQDASAARIEAATTPNKSIAVLPFENLSDDKSNAYFAEGIQDEILTRLSKIAALKVISRTSTQKYKSAPDNLREVGQQLGVANLLEGSVQKAGNAVHINVQLIKAATDEHLWAESYNRKLDDVFGVEGEVAGSIADQLKAKLTNEEKKELAAKPTNNLEAYDAFLRGVALAERPDEVTSDLHEAIGSFETAVKLDPDFALAWAWLSATYSELFFYAEASPAHRDAAQAALQNALRLQPNLIETLNAQAYYLYHVERNYEAARNIFEQIRATSPNDAGVPLALALISRRQGRWDESLSEFNKAAEFDPRNLQVLLWASDTYVAMRQFPAALRFIDRVLDIAPADNGALTGKARIYQALGQLEKANAVLKQTHLDSGDPPDMQVLAVQLLFERNYTDGTTLMQSLLAKLDATDLVGRAFYTYYLGQFQRLSGDAASARDSYQESHDAAEPLLRQQPDSASPPIGLAMAYMGLGEKDAALKQAELAVAKLPATKDAYIGPNSEEWLARVLAHFGEKDRALKILQHLLITPYTSPITPALLRLDPDWDNLRGDPRFQKLCQEPTQ